MTDSEGEKKRKKKKKKHFPFFSHSARVSEDFNFAFRVSSF